MKKKNIFKYLICSLLILLFLMSGVATYGQVSPNQRQFLPALNEEEPASASGTQALIDGYKMVSKGEEELGDTGKPGLEGFSPNQPYQPFFLPALNQEEPTSASEAQALIDGYKMVSKGEEELGDTGKPGLEGFTPNQPFFLPALNQEEPTSASESQALVEGMVMR